MTQSLPVLDTTHTAALMTGHVMSFAARMAIATAQGVAEDALDVIESFWKPFLPFFPPWLKTP